MEKKQKPPANYVLRAFHFKHDTDQFGCGPSNPNAVIEVNVTVQRKDGAHILPRNGGGTKTRFRRAVTATVNITGRETRYTGTSICRPPDKFNEKQGMDTCLKTAVKRFVNSGEVPASSKEKVVSTIFDMFHNYQFYKNRPKNEERKAKRLAKKKEMEAAKS